MKPTDSPTQEKKIGFKVAIGAHFFALPQQNDFLVGWDWFCIGDYRKPSPTKFSANMLLIFVLRGDFLRNVRCMLASQG